MTNIRYAQDQRSFYWVHNLWIKDLYDLPQPQPCAGVGCEGGDGEETAARRTVCHLGFGYCLKIAVLK